MKNFSVYSRSRENQKHTFYVQLNFFRKTRRLRDNLEKYYTALQATGDSIIGAGALQAEYLRLRIHIQIM
jgi:hypothetical protein